MYKFFARFLIFLYTSAELSGVHSLPLAKHFLYFGLGYNLHIFTMLVGECSPLGSPRN